MNRCLWLKKNPGITQVVMLMVLTLLTQFVSAHHVLGRPSYSLNADSNTPPSMQIETQIGKYFVTYMVFPAFPKPNVQGRVNLYVKRIKDDKPFDGEVTFTIRDDAWFARNEETLGKQPSINNIFKQGFVFKNAGHYIISAKFSADNEPYTIDFPLRIGSPFPIGPIGITILLIFVMLLVVNVLLSKKMKRLKAQRNRDENIEPAS